MLLVALFRRQPICYTSARLLIQGCPINIYGRFLPFPSQGADDIFVFANTWKYIRRLHPDMPVDLQLQKALTIGGKAMVRLASFPSMLPGKRSLKTSQFCLSNEK